MTILNVNRKQFNLDAPPDTPMLWILRDSMGLTGTKFGCGAGLCGACTIHVDGAATRSCVLPLSAAAGRDISTIESVTEGNDRIGQAVRSAWIKNDVAQCGYCQSGQIMAAVAFLKSLAPGNVPTPEEVDVAMAGNLCRCGTYQRVRAAVIEAAQAIV